MAKESELLTENNAVVIIMQILCHPLHWITVAARFCFKREDKSHSGAITRATECLAQISS